MDADAAEALLPFDPVEFRPMAPASAPHSHDPLRDITLRWKPTTTQRPQGPALLATCSCGARLWLRTPSAWTDDEGHQYPEENPLKTWDGAMFYARQFAALLSASEEAQHARPPDGGGPGGTA